MIVNSIYLFDVAAFITIVITAFLSKRLGDALKIPAFYILMYGMAGGILAALGADLFIDSPIYIHGIALHTVTLGLRCGCGLVALAIAIRYWHWLIGESLKK